MTDYLLASKPYYLWIALALPVFSSLFLISKIHNFEKHFVVSTEIPTVSEMYTIGTVGL